VSKYFKNILPLALVLVVSLAYQVISIADCDAAVLANRAALNTLLGASAVTDDFESYPIADGDAIYFNPAVLNLNSSTIINAQGPNLVNSGASYVCPSTGIQWNGNNYYSLPTRTILCNDTYIDIVYTAPVQAMGFDIFGYNGYGFSGSAEVYGTSGLIETVPISTSGAPSSIFFGYEYTSGITSVRLIDNTHSWSPIINDHTYGVLNAIPTMNEWGMIIFAALAGIGSVYYLRKRYSA